MDSTGPPDFGRQPARFGPRCDSCAHHDKVGGRCRKYSVQVEIYTCCDSWERDPDHPIEVV
jgi:hypothetical protein